MQCHCDNVATPEAPSIGPLSHRILMLVTHVATYIVVYREPHILFQGIDNHHYIMAIINLAQSSRNMKKMTSPAQKAMREKIATQCLLMRSLDVCHPPAVGIEHRIGAEG